MRPAAIQPSQPSAHYRSRGSVVLVVAAVLFLIALAANLALPAWQRSQRLTHAQAAAAQLKQFATAFQNFAQSRGDWPAAAAPGAVPTGMEKALANTPWLQPTPLGGRYVWLTNTMERGERVQAAIAIVSAGSDRVAADSAQLDELLRQANDPRLRLGFQNQPVLVLEH